MLGSVLAVEDDKRQPGLAATSAHVDESSRGQRKSRRKVLIAVIVVVAMIVALAIGGAVTVWSFNQDRTAQDTAQQYFNALAAGDAGVAHALTDPSSLANGSLDFLTDEVLAGATERISDVSVEPANDPLDTFDQNVIVTYSLAGERHTVPLTLSRGEREWGLLNTYQLSEPFAHQTSFTSEGAGAFTVAGIPVNSQTPSTRVFPGVYPVASADPTYLALEQDQLVVNGVDRVAPVTFQPTAELQAEVQRQVNGHLDECAAALETAAQAQGCPLLVYVPHAEATAGTWEIVEYPTVELGLNGTYFSTTGGVARFTPTDGSDAVDTFRGIDHSGTVEVADGEVHVNHVAG